MLLSDFDKNYYLTVLSKVTWLSSSLATFFPKLFCFFFDLDDEVCDLRIAAII
jgi:hypothetical protein